MKAFVLMDKRTGDLFEAYRVCFLDTPVNERFLSNTAPTPVRFGLLEHHGWVVIHPTTNATYFNHNYDELFENLGEL